MKNPYSARGNIMSTLFIVLALVFLVLSAGCKTQNTSRGPDEDKNHGSQQTSIANRLESTESFKPKNGYVLDEQIAIAIAVAVWTPIYGREQIESEKPFKASLTNGVWTVTGTLKQGYDGGTAFAEIAQDDGRIIRVIHYQ